REPPQRRSLIRGVTRRAPRECVASGGANEYGLVARAARQDGCLLARGQLSLRRSDLLARQPLVEEAARRRAREATPPPPLGHDARPELRLRAPEPHHPRARSVDDLYLRTRARRAGTGGEHLSRRHLQRGLPPRLAGRGGAQAA